MALTMKEDRKRQKHRAHYVEIEKTDEKRRSLTEKWQQETKAEPIKKIVMPVLPSYPPYPNESIDLTCGAKTRKGTPCKRKDLYACGRCRLHGGLSTGPKTMEGKKRSSLNGFKPKRNKKADELGISNEQ